MGRFDRLAEHKMIGLDTAVFIYHLEANPRYLPLTTELLNWVQNGRCQAVISTVLLMELTVHPWRKGQTAVAYRYEALLANFPNLHIADVNRDVARRAAQIRATHRLKPADALHIASAQHSGATAWVSNDLQHRRMGAEMSVIILDEA